MAARYGDSSALVKLYVQETGSAWVTGLFDPVAANAIITALVTGAEIVSAIVRRSRMGSITAPDAAAAVRAFRSEFAGRYEIVPVTDAVLEQAMDLVERHGLRGFDAIHLACALAVRDWLAARSAGPLTFLSADANLNAAAEAEGLLVDNPNTHP